ncbi:hypothetical protein ACCT30_30605, partial [Rhizobium ruizarguesonis]
IWSCPEEENKPPNRDTSELQPVAALASRQTTRRLPADFPNFGERLKLMTRPTENATICESIKTR